VSFIVAACLATTLPPVRAQSSSVANSADAARASLAEKAHALEARGRPDLAIQLWQQILLSDPRNTAALAGLAQDYKLIGSDSLANQTLDRLRAINPNDRNDARIESMSSSSPSPKSGQLEGSSPSTPPTAPPNPPSPSDHHVSKVALNTPSPSASGPSGQYLYEKAPSARDAASGAYSAPPQQTTPQPPTQPDASLTSSANTSSCQTSVPACSSAKTPFPEPAPAIAQSKHKLPDKSTRQSAQQYAPHSTQPQKEQPTQTLAEAPLGAPESAAPNSGPAPNANAASTEAQTQTAPAQQPQLETTGGATCLIAIPEHIGTYAGGYPPFDYLVSIFTARIQWKADDDNNQDAFTRGAGGYFSPRAYFLANAPLSWQGNYGARWHSTVENASDMQAFQQDATPLWPLAGDKALETSQNNPMLPNLSNFSPSYDLQSQVAYQIRRHWFIGAYLAANNACNYAYPSVGSFGRYMLRQQPSTVTAPTGLFPADGPRPFTIP
jgi:tetratricopeptide (TPR) repeat protein